MFNVRVLLMFVFLSCNPFAYQNTQKESDNKQYELDSGGRVVLMRRFFEKNFRIGQNRRLLQQRLVLELAESAVADEVLSVKVLADSRIVEIEVVMKDFLVAPDVLGVVNGHATKVVARADLSQFKVTLLDVKGTARFRCVSQLSVLERDEHKKGKKVDTEDENRKTKTGTKDGNRDRSSKRE